MRCITSTVFVDADELFSYLIGMSPEQCRAARGWLGWSQQELADHARIGLSTVRDFEAGRRQPIINNIEAIRRALEAAGVELVFRDDGSPGGIAERKG